MGAAQRVSIPSVLRDTAESLIDFIWPPLCLLCGEFTGTRESLVCGSCRNSLKTHGFVCSRCGSPRNMSLPIKSTVAGGRAKGLCRDCWDHEPPFYQARSFGPHTPPLSHLIYHLKYRRRPQLAEFLSSLLAETFFTTGWSDINAIIAVPTTRWRLWRRGYNQAELLAARTADRIGLPIIKDVVVRLMGKSQVGYHSKEREWNVRRAFLVRDHRQILHKHLLLIDDVYTTGATARAMTRILISAGARKVSLLTLSSTGRHY